MPIQRPHSIRAYDDGIDRWEVVDALPAPELRRHVLRYGSYFEHTASFSARRELATTSGVLIYALEQPLEIVGADGTMLIVKTGEAFVGGILDSTSLSRALGPQQGMHVFLPLASLAAITGAPLAEIANTVVPFADLVGDQADALGAALCEAADREARFALLDRFLASQLTDTRTDNRTIEWAMRQLGTERAPSSSVLAREIGWSRRHFSRRFRAVTGFTPDRFRRIARFERFSAAIVASPQAGLAGLAAEAGFADQAHLTRDVRNFAAMTPGQLRARLIPAGGGIRHD